MSLRPARGRWKVFRIARSSRLPHIRWRACCPSSGSDGLCRCEWFPTHAEAIAYADRWARS